MKVLTITGTSTGVGKTMVTAAVAAAAISAGERVVVVKPVQTGVTAGEAGDTDEVYRLTGGACECHELMRYPDPLAPAAAARVAGLPEPDIDTLVRMMTALGAEADLLIVEGAGGLLVPFDSRGSTIADMARRLRSPVVVVADPGLGTLNHTALTCEALRTRKLKRAGVVLGSWPAAPDLASRTNLTDLPALIGEPLAGALPAGASALSPEQFRAVAQAGLSPRLGGRFNGTIDVSRPDPDN